MSRNHSQPWCPFRWQFLRWLLALPILPLALWACSSHTLQQPQPSKQQETDFDVNISPVRAVDIVFVIDNSASMEEEQANLAKNFPQMINVLKELKGGLPDVHLAVVDSDVGAGSKYCGTSPPAGDWGLMWGNPTDDMSDFANVNKRTPAPDPAGCGLNEGARWIEDIQGGKQKNYTGDISSVFACLANVGVTGCGYEHQLQALRVALTGQNANLGFLRSDAYLAIILVTDEDDCSAEQSTDMFLSSDTLLGESASLRCATRGHICSGEPIPYYDVEKGFNPPDPNAAVGFQTAFKDCAPRTDKDLPLIQVDQFIDTIKGLKEQAKQIIVAGIYGWPMEGEEDSAQYKIGKDPTPAYATMKDDWDYLPVCESKGLGKAYGGLRLRKFIEAFGGKTFPICQDSFEQPMKRIGEAIAKAISPGCVEYWLVDDNTTEDGVQAECTVTAHVPKIIDGKHTSDDSLIPRCDGSDVRPCWNLEQDKENCPTTGQRIVVTWPIDTKTNKEQVQQPNTILSMKCLTCPDGSDSKLCPH